VLDVTLPYALRVALGGLKGIPDIAAGIVLLASLQKSHRGVAFQKRPETESKHRKEKVFKIGSQDPWKRMGRGFTPRVHFRKLSSQAFSHS
jgi:hypothetical protein